MKTFERSNGSRHDAALVAAARTGDEEAFTRLYDTHVDRVFAIVMNVVHNEATAADLIQDTFIAAWRQLSRLEKPASFRYWLARIARNAALNHVKVAGRTEAIDNTAITELEEEANATETHALVGLDVTDRAFRHHDPAQASEDAEACELLWTAAEVLGPNDVTLLDLHLRHNMSPAQIAPIVGASRHAMKQALWRLRAKLATSVEAAVLWRGGRPRCDTLRSALDTASIIDFSREAVGVIDRHVKNCPACKERQRTLVSPTVLFEAIPAAAAPSQLRDRIVAAIAGPRPVSSVAGARANAAGVPTGGIGRGVLTQLLAHPLVETVTKMVTDAVAATAAVLVAGTLVAGGVGTLQSGPAIVAATASKPIERNLATPPADLQDTPIPTQEPSDGPGTTTLSDETPRPNEVAQDNSGGTQATNPGQEKQTDPGKEIPDTRGVTNTGTTEENPDQPMGTGTREEPASDPKHEQGKNRLETDRDGEQLEEDRGQGN